MNPRPETFNLGFYMLILNFEVDCHVSFRRDTRQHSLRNFNRKASGALFRRSCIIDALTGSAGKCRQDGSCFYAATA